MKKIIAFLLCAVLAGAALGCGSKDKSEASAGDADLLSGLHYAEIEVEDYGTISLELDADTAPITVTNFVNLAKDGFYDGLTFHRIIDGFMIQGGDPLGNGTGGSDETIKGEFSDNGVENDISHVRGTISMARSSDPDSASSQFFIVHQDSTYLDGQYAAFGHVTDGMDVVDAICEDTPVQDNNGTVAADNQPVITSITISEYFCIENGCRKTAAAHSFYSAFSQAFPSDPSTFTIL